MKVGPRSGSGRPGRGTSRSGRPASWSAPSWRDAGPATARGPWRPPGGFGRSSRAFEQQGKYGEVGGGGGGRAWPPLKDLEDPPHFLREVGRERPSATSGAACPAGQVGESGPRALHRAMEAVPLHLKQANKFGRKHHARGLPCVGCKFAIGCMVDDKFVVVAIAGSPVARWGRRGCRRGVAAGNPGSPCVHSTR